MKQSVRPVLAAAVAFALLGSAPRAVLPAYATVQEIILNSSTVQIVHNPSPNTDVLNISLDVTNDGDAGSCDGEDDDLLEGGVAIGVAEPSCASQNDFFAFGFNYVEHDIAGSSYGTFFGSLFLTAPITEASKIVPLATPPGACGRWKINFPGGGTEPLRVHERPDRALGGRRRPGRGQQRFRLSVLRRQREYRQRHHQAASRSA